MELNQLLAKLEAKLKQQEQEGAVDDRLLSQINQIKALLGA
jgi:hypothetical protein